jgi:hypothetical protein
MPPATVADLDALIKKRYSNRAPSDLTRKKHAFLKRVRKETDFTGKDFSWAVEGANPQGYGSDFTAAQANKSAIGDAKQFTLKPSQFYGFLSLSTKAILMMTGGDSSFVPAKMDLFDRIMSGMVDDLALKLFLDGTGVKALYASATGKVITLGTAEHAKRFSPGEVLQYWDVSAGSLGDSGATVTVASVDEDAGTITIAGGSNVSAVWSSIAGGATPDKIVRKSEYDSAPTTNFTNFMGLEAIIPATAPSALESFLGVDRSTYPSRYAGYRISATAGDPIRKMITRLATKIGDGGGSPDTVLISHTNFELLANELDNKKTYNDVKDGAAGFSGLRIHVNDNTLDILPDVYCPSNRIYCLTMDTWALKTVGPAPRLLDQDGNNGVRESTADGVEWRWGGYGNLYCRSPGENGVCSIS